MVSLAAIRIGYCRRLAQCGEYYHPSFFRPGHLNRPLASPVRTELACSSFSFHNSRICTNNLPLPLEPARPRQSCRSLSSHIETLPSTLAPIFPHRINPSIENLTILATVIVKHSAAGGYDQACATVSDLRIHGRVCLHALVYLC